MKSKFVVIEGLEGAGKTTARNTVVNMLNLKNQTEQRIQGG